MRCSCREVPAVQWGQGTWTTSTSSHKLRKYWGDQKLFSLSPLPSPLSSLLSPLSSLSLSFFPEAKIQPTDNLSEAASGNFSRKQIHLRFHSRRHVAILPARQILTHIKIMLAPTNLQKQTNNSMRMWWSWFSIHWLIWNEHQLFWEACACCLKIPLGWNAAQVQASGPWTTVFDSETTL